MGCKFFLTVDEFASAICGMLAAIIPKCVGPAFLTGFRRTRIMCFSEVYVLCFVSLNWSYEIT